MRRDSGIALILTLLVLTLLILVVAQMTLTSMQHTTLARNSVGDLQNTYGVKSGYAQAIVFLQADLERKPQVDSLDERWAQPVEFSCGESQVTVTIEDEQRKLNLSDLVDAQGRASEPARQRLERLLTALGHDPAIAARIQDYIDPDATGEYEAGARNAPLFNVEELLRIEGVGREVLYGGAAQEGETPRKGLIDYVTLWPRLAAAVAAPPPQPPPPNAPPAPPQPPAPPGPASRINVNTTPPEVLMALDERMTEAIAQAVVARREERDPQGQPRPFSNVAEVAGVQDMPAELFQAIQPMLAVRSSHFMIRARSSSGNVEKEWIYVVERNVPSGGSSPPPPAAGDEPKRYKLLATYRRYNLLSLEPDKNLSE